MEPYPQTTDVPRALPIVAWAMLVIMPVSLLALAQFVEVATPTKGAPYDMITYILLAVAVLDQLPVPIIERLQVGNFRKTKGSRASRGQFFLSVAIMRMAPVTAVYMMGFIVFMVGGELTRMLYFYPIGLFMTYLRWPTEARREAFFQKLEVS